MSFLDSLAPDQRHLLITLPYRVGFWVSQSDVSGGSESDAKELQALSNILGGYAGEVFVSETVQYVISETLNHRDEWPQWCEDLGDVQGDCRRAVGILSDAVDEKEVNAFKQHLMEIGEAVALSFREIDELSFSERLKYKIRYWLLRLRAKRAGQSYKSFEEFLNISSNERKALEGMARALDINYAI